MIRLMMSLLMVLAALPVTAATYTITEQEGTPLDNPPGASTVVWENTDTGYPNDDDKRLVNIGFTFRFGTTDYTQLRILTNGILHFGADQRLHRDYTNEQLPTNEGDRLIAVYWDDLVDDNQSSVTYGMMGSAPDRKFVVTWNNVRAYSNNNRYDFQVVLYEGGNIRYRYNNNTANGQSATIGVEVDDSDYTLYSHNVSSVETNFDLLFENTLLAPPPAVLNWRFDESSWSGAADEVLDSSVNGLHGTVQNDAANENASPAIPGSPGSCRYGNFDGNNDYIERADNALLDLGSTFTVAAWVNINTLPNNGLKSILSKDENYEFHIDSAGRIFWWWQDSAGSRSITSTAVLSPGQWYHVAIRFTQGQQTLFVNALPAGSASHTRVPLTNSDPLQVGADQGQGSRRFNGLLDEIYISDQALSDLQMINLKNWSRPCFTSTITCSNSFPDGASSHNGGNMSFGYNAQLYFSPDNQLDFNNVSVNGGSTASSCVTTDCTANGNSANPLTLPSFPATNFTPDVTVPNNGTGTIGNSGNNEYDNVRVRNRGTLNVSTAFDTYYFDSLRLDSRATINMPAGDYWISSLTLNSQTNINVTGGGTVRIYVDGNITFGDTSLINSPGLNSAGDASQLLIVSYGNIRLRSNATVSAVMYSQGDTTFDSPSYLHGAVTADDVTMNSSAQIRYQSTAVADLDFGGLCVTSCPLGSFNITQPAYALACPQTRAAISVTAICDDGSTVKNDYTGTVNLSGPAISTFHDASTAGNQISSYTFVDSDAGVKTVYLYFNNENSDVKVTVADSAASVSSTAVTGTDFRAYGFRVSSPSSLISTACSNDLPMTLTAYGRTQDGSGQECEVLTGFSGNKTMDVWYAVDVDGDAVQDTVTTPLTVSGIAVTQQSSTPADVNNLTLSFTSGQSTFNVNYANAGKVMSLNFRHNESPYDGSPFSFMAASADKGLVYYPSEFALSAASGVTALNSTSSGGTPVQGAGVDFNLQLTAQCANGSTATDYQPNNSNSLEGYVQRTGPTSGGADGRLQVSASTSLLSNTAAPGTYQTMGIAGSNFVNGVYSYALADYSEVGLIRLHVQDANYFGVADIAGSSLAIGRFIPDHFQLSLISAGEFDNACTSSTTDFTYNGQGFSYSAGLLPAVKVTPRNAANQTVMNYIGAFRKLNNPAMVSRPAMLASANPGVDASNLQVSASYQSATLADNGSSIDYTFSSSDVFTYARTANALVAPFAVNLGLLINGVNDGEASGIEGAASYTVTPGGSARQYYGRLNVENTFGPETDDLTYPVTSQYWNGNDFVTNSDDDCTVIADSQITTNPLGSGVLTGIAVGAGTSDLSRDPSFTDGSAEYLFTAPGAGNTGDIGISFDLSPYPWLQFDWDGNGSDGNPADTTAIFGQYRGHDKVIFWREVTY